MLYIPVESDYTTPVSLKRSLSDPEIYFPSAVRHSLIVAVNGMMPHEKISTASCSQGNWTHAEKPDKVIKNGHENDWECIVSKPSNPSQPDAPIGDTIGAPLQINVIQPTPNISPSHSLHSISRESKDSEAEPQHSENFAGIPFLIVPPSPIRVRRFSFSDNSLEHEEESEDTASLSETKIKLTQPDISITMTEPQEEEGDKDTPSTTKSRRKSRCVSRQASLQVILLLKIYSSIMKELC